MSTEVHKCSDLHYLQALIPNEKVNHLLLTSCATFVCIFVVVPSTGAAAGSAWPTATGGGCGRTAVAMILQQFLQPQKTTNARNHRNRDGKDEDKKNSNAPATVKFFEYDTRSEKINSTSNSW